MEMAEDHNKRTTNCEEGTTIPIQARDLESYALFAHKPPDTLFHYTDLEGAKGIISSKSLWLTKVQYLNDNSELKFAIDLFRFRCRNRIDAIADQESKDFLDRAANQLSGFENTNLCVASFCANGDLLSQWRAYRKNGSGVALGFSSKVLKGSLVNGPMSLWKCIYDSGDQLRIVDDLVNQLLDCYALACRTVSDPRRRNEDENSLIGYFNTTFLRVAPILKNAHFREEEEWRVILLPTSFRNENYHAHITNRRVFEYYSLDIVKHVDIFKTIVIGPSQGQRLIANAFEVLLFESGFQCKDIGASQIPYDVKQFYS